MATEQEVKQVLGENQGLVNISVEGNYIIVKPKEYIKAKGVWTAITNALRNLKGEWIPANKDSHWRVPHSQLAPNKFTPSDPLAITKHIDDIKNEIADKLEALKKEIEEMIRK